MPYRVGLHGGGIVLLALLSVVEHSSSALTLAFQQKMRQLMTCVVCFLLSTNVAYFLPMMSLHLSCKYAGASPVGVICTATNCLLLVRPVLCQRVGHAYTSHTSPGYHQLNSTATDNETPSNSYVMWDHIELPSTRHK